MSMSAVATPAPETSAASDHRGKSHSARRQSRNRKGSDSDPFLELSDDGLKLSQQPPPSDEKNRSGRGRWSSRLADLVLTPVNMVSFVLSLFLVDHQERQWRLSQHSSGSDSYRPSFIFGSWLMDPEPYQESHDGKGASARSDASFHGYYRRKKHRAMAKMNINDAFEMRGRVLFSILAGMLIGVCAIMYATWRLYAWVC